MSEPAKPVEPTQRESRLRWILIAGVGGIMLLYFVAAVFEQPLQADNFTNSYSHSPGGHSALRELLAKNGRATTAGEVHLQLPAWEGTRTDTLTLIEPGPSYVDRYLEEISGIFATAREERSSLLIAFPKRHYEQVDAPDEEEVVLEEFIIPLEEVRGILATTGFDRWMTLERRAIAKPSIVWTPPEGTSPDASGVRFEADGLLQTFRAKGQLPSGFTVLAASDNGAPVIVRYRANEYDSTGGVILVSDADFLTNRYIAQPGAAEIAMRLFKETPSGGDILIDEDLHGFSTDASLEYLAATPPGLWVTLSAFLLLGVFAWRQATVLRPRKAEVQDRRARKYSIEGLARMMERAGEHDAAHRRIMKRSRLVLGAGRAEVQGAGQGNTRGIQKGKTGRITRIEGGTSEERLINAARKVAHQKRTGEAEHNDWSFD